MKLLHIDSSLKRDASVSRKLTQKIVEKVESHYPKVEIQYVDLDVNFIPHLGSLEVIDEDRKLSEDSQRTLKQFLWADVVVLGAPMYNFSIPSTLKAWIDRIAVKEHTFRYTPQGPEGLVGDKKVIIALSYGGKHDNEKSDFVRPYLMHTFDFFGISNPTFILAEGLDISEESRKIAVEGALKSISTLAF